MGGLKCLARFSEYLLDDRSTKSGDGLRKGMWRHQSQGWAIAGYPHIDETELSLPRDVGSC